MVYSVYKAFLLHKHSEGCSAETARQALPQFAREAVRYHLASRRCVAHWLPVHRIPANPGQHPLEEEADALEAVREVVG